MGRLLTSPTNIRLGWQYLPRSNTLAYYKYSYLATVKSFITLAPGVNVRNLFTFIIDKCS